MASGVILTAGDASLPSTFLGLRLWVEQEVQAHVKRAVRELQGNAAVPSSALQEQLPASPPLQEGRGQRLEEVLREQRRQAAELRQLHEAMSSYGPRPCTSAAHPPAGDRAVKERLHTVTLNIADQSKRLRRVTEEVSLATEGLRTLGAEVKAVASTASIASDNASKAACSAASALEAAALSRKETEAQAGHQMVALQEVRAELVRQAGCLREVKAEVVRQAAWLREVNAEVVRQAACLREALANALLRPSTQREADKEVYQHQGDLDGQSDVGPKPTASAHPKQPDRGEAPLDADLGCAAGSHPGRSQRASAGVLGTGGQRAGEAPGWDGALAAAQAHLHLDAGLSSGCRSHGGGDHPLDLSHDPLETTRWPVAAEGQTHLQLDLTYDPTESLQLGWSSRADDLGWDEVLTAAQKTLQAGDAEGGSAPHTFGSEAGSGDSLEGSMAAAAVWPAADVVREAPWCEGGGREGRGALRGLAAAALAGRALMEAARGLVASAEAVPGNGVGDAVGRSPASSSGRSRGALHGGEGHWRPGCDSAGGHLVAGAAPSSDSDDAGAPTTPRTAAAAAAAARRQRRAAAAAAAAASSVAARSARPATRMGDFGHRLLGATAAGSPR